MTDESSRPVTVRLPEVLDLKAADPLRSELLNGRGRPLELDASLVQRVGAQCLQVLLAAKAVWAADGAPFRLVEPSEAFREGVALLGAPALEPASSVVE